MNFSHRVRGLQEKRPKAPLLAVSYWLDFWANPGEEGALRMEDTMGRDEIERGLKEITERFGPWTAHDIDLGCGISTLGKGLWQQWRVDFFAGLIEESFTRVAHRPRILDLACLEGLFAIEFARLGHETVGLEVREQHLAKAEFVRHALGLDLCRFVQGDVRHIPPELGSFDVTLCAGILYHLDFPDCVTFLRDIAARTNDLLIIDSHFAYDHIHTSVLPLSPMLDCEFIEQTYRGRRIVEHAEHVSDTEKRTTHGWASIDNNFSLWLAEQDVVRILNQSKFELVVRKFPNAEYEGQNPDRPTLVFRRA